MNPYMDIELNTILFYQELRQNIKARSVKDALTEIIIEEKTHLIKLKKIRAKIDPVYAGKKRLKIV